MKMQRNDVRGMYEIRVLEYRGRMKIDEGRIKKQLIIRSWRR
jgi:hypothetical protein